MNLRSAWPRFSASFLAVVALYASNGCSFFYELNTTQCEVPADCFAFGPQFSNTTCINRVCVEKSGNETGGSTNGGSTNGGSKNTGGAGKGGAGGGGNSSTAGSSGDTGEGGIVGQGGMAGAGMGGEGGGISPPECTTNAECIAAHDDVPYICRDEKCVELTNEHCPVLLPSNGNLEILRDAVPPIVIGGYASMANEQDRKDTVAAINWNLAFDEFAGAMGIASKQPRMVGLICQGLAAEFDVEASMTHLAHTVGVRGILSTLASDNLDAAWQFTQTPEYEDAGAKPVFFMSTGSADLRLANLEDNGLVWHQLGDPRGFAATTASLVKLIEPHVKAVRQSLYDANPTATGAENPAVVPLRVTLVYADDPTMLDVAKVLTTPNSAQPQNVLTFNGNTATHASNVDNFRQVRIESGRVHVNPPPVITNGVVDVQGNPPHIVVGMGTSEFPQLMSQIEATWGAPGSASEGKARPFYVLSHFIPSQPALATAMESNKVTNPPLHLRTVGVNYALAQDAHSKELYDYYLAELRAHYGKTPATGGLNVAGSENHYDGAYGLLYSVVAASSFVDSDVLDGNHINSGWQDKVIKRNAAISVDVGGTNIADTARQLANASYGMSLWGTMGSPDFDRLSGTRNSPTSAWCFQYRSGSTTVWEPQYDALLYSLTTHTFSDPPPAGLPTCMQPY